MTPSHPDTIEAYDELLNSGMFHELHPNLTGMWEEDQVECKLNMQMLSERNRKTEEREAAIAKAPELQLEWRRGTGSTKRWVGTCQCIRWEIIEEEGMHALYNDAHVRIGQFRKVGVAKEVARLITNE